MELAVAGSSDFTLGFRLAGISTAVDVRSSQDVVRLLGSQQVAVVIMDQQTFDGLSEPLQDDVMRSIKPVFVVLSEKPQDELRKMIIRSIGVDLLREEG